MRLPPHVEIVAFLILLPIEWLRDRLWRLRNVSNEDHDRRA